MNEQFKTAISDMTTGTQKLIGEQRVQYQQAEAEQRQRAEFQSQQAREYQQRARAAQAGIMQEEPMTELQKAAQGKVESPAEILIKQQARENQARAQAAAFARGYNPAAQRAAIMAGSQAQVAASGQAATMRAQEMAQARESFANAYLQRQNQLQQAEQFGLQLGMNAEQLYQRAVDIKLAQAESEKSLVSSMILNKMGMQQQAAQLSFGAQMQQSQSALGARQQQAQSALAARQQAATQGLALKEGASRMNVAAQQDIINQGLAQQAALGQQTLGIQSQATAAGGSLLAEQMQAQQQNQQFYAQLAQNKELANAQLAQQKAQFEESSGWGSFLKGIATTAIGGLASGAGTALTKGAFEKPATPTAGK